MLDSVKTVLRNSGFNFAFESVIVDVVYSNKTHCQVVAGVRKSQEDVSAEKGFFSEKGHFDMMSDSQFQVKDSLKSGF